MIATLANHCWQMASTSAAREMRAALARPQLAQDRLLMAWLHRHRGCAWGRAHGFADLDSDSFRAKHPVTSWEDYRPWIERIANGEQAVLSADPVRAFLPTSGSSGARKLIPVTAGLQRAFRTGVDCWMHALFADHPGTMGGKAYWSLSPPAFPSDRQGSIPVGFADDSAYLGRIGAWLARATFATPPSLARMRDPQAWRTATCLHLLRCADLHLISVWSPSFLSILWQAILADWDRLLADPGWTSHRRRHLQLSSITTPTPALVWPRLALISCWTHGASQEAASLLATCFSGVPLQPKGLVATEAIISIPWSRNHEPLPAITAQVIEFESADGRLHGPEDVEIGQAYGIVVSNGGGLWRYRLGDQVAVTGRIGATPTLRFLGRCGGVSDQRGEKLHPIPVEQAVRLACAHAGLTPTFLLLAPEATMDGIAYHLFIELPGSLPPHVLDDLADDLDRRLAENPHYAHCRRMGQLGALTVVPLPGPSGRATAIYQQVQLERGLGMGDIKPGVLVTTGGWKSRLEAPVAR